MYSLLNRMCSLWSFRSDRETPSPTNIELPRYSGAASVQNTFWHRLPFDIIQVVIGCSDSATAAAFALTCHSLLSVSRKHLYYDIEISSNNISRLIQHSLHLLSYTRKVTFHTLNVMDPNRKKNHEQIFRNLLHHQVLTHFDCQGYYVDSDLKQILQIAAMPSVNWFGMDLNPRSTISPLIFDILRTPSLRRVMLKVSEHDIVPAFHGNSTARLPPLTTLSLWSMSKVDPVASHDIIKPWASWFDLETLEDLCINSIPGAVLPPFPKSNNMKWLLYGIVPDPESLVSNLPILKNLQTLTIEWISSTDMTRILDLFPHDLIIQFYFTICIQSDVLRSVDELNGWALVACRIGDRVLDRHRFNIELVEEYGNIHPGWVAQMKEAFHGGSSRDLAVFIRELEDGSKMTKRVVRLNLY
ncbi:hypothetical protein DL96DRAFT_1615213 [Flagelloscypha sp. PMI_526]|nr:hypothetical protein DL96DRAFT_1615213 [Flagelloscypha sp. PMI_526]